MASSSFIPTGGWTYDVFLSFRGEDTRNNFVDHLYAALDRNGLTVFKDDKMLRVGKEISPELMKAIQESTCTVVVFSKNYANSSWCLAELAEIWECNNNPKELRRLVIPVFYHVDPSDVRGQRRDFETAFKQHEERFKEEMDRVKEWRQALTAAANLSGYHISETEGESSFVTKIVRDILERVRPYVMENNLIGIKSHINKLKSLLNLEAMQEVRMVGIWGMGGIGKTSIARALFGGIRYEFDGCCFISDVRENSFSKRDICALQEKILNDITHHEYKITDQEEGAQMIKNRFCKKKVLLVLDDVDDANQLEVLAETHEWFGKGSRIIITTRDRQLLIDTDTIYSPGFLPEEHAVELFSRHAFKRNSPPEGYKELSNRAIRYTGCLPLALKVLGSFFRGKREVSVWERILERLAKTENNESFETPFTQKRTGIFKTLKISFDGLEDSEKSIFLDIACFFIGGYEKKVTRMLDSSRYDSTIGIRSLIEKSLITISRGCIVMHDVLREMGLEIVRKSYPNSRIWQLNEIHDFITKNRNLEAIEAIVAKSFDNAMGFSADVFENMKNIRLFHNYGNFTYSKPTTLPDELEWLEWNYYPFNSLPEANLRKLVTLGLVEGQIEHLWIGYKVMPYLKFIHLEGLDCLQSFPDVSGAPNIVRLILFFCPALKEVHESLGSLRKLAYLKISNCWSLEYLPSLIEMPLLETLDLSYCHSLKRFPEVVHSGLKKLSSINLHSCFRLKTLPEDLGSLVNLKELQLSLFTYSDQISCFNFHSLTKLCCLRKLDLSSREIEDKNFLNHLDAFSSLEELNLSGNPKWVKLPESISRISRLKHLKLDYCQRLKNIQGLPSGIQVLVASYCTALEKIEDLTDEYASLHKIILYGCDGLLENQENERYLDKMLQQTFIKKCIALDRQLSIWLPRREIPSWFEQQDDRREIALKFPPKHHTSIMGFAICVVFKKERILTLSIIYIPISAFWRRMQLYDGDLERDDWSPLLEGRCSLIMKVVTISSLKVERCGAHIVYKEETESIQQINTSISDYWNSEDKDCGDYVNELITYRIEFKFRSIGL